eukprot:GHVR01018121.1.p1 GENE.GHVR01018121.1~~GHVR01018121.1.p1  ORF type:complete len:145 (+),score=39.37 GHVR01018121.1:25-459(+)
MCRVLIVLLLLQHLIVDCVDISVHRGYGCSMDGCLSPMPENSLMALDKAVDEKVTAVEIDVWLTADSKVVVVHGDDSIKGGSISTSVRSRVGYEDVIIEDSNYNQLLKDKRLCLKPAYSLQLICFASNKKKHTHTHTHTRTHIQ